MEDTLFICLRGHDRDTLSTMVQDRRFVSYRKVMEWLLETGKKLEQECVGILA